MLRRARRDVCRICKRNLPKAAARCPWCSYGNDETVKPATPNAPTPRDERHASSRWSPPVYP